jgi:hypothetical protein
MMSNHPRAVKSSTDFLTREQAMKLELLAPSSPDLAYRTVTAGLAQEETGILERYVDARIAQDARTLRTSHFVHVDNGRCEIELAKTRKPIGLTAYTPAWTRSSTQLRMLLSRPGKRRFILPIDLRGQRLGIFAARHH